MSNRFIRAATALLFGFLTVSAAAEVRLQLYTEEYPPITFARDGKAAGLGTDVVEEIMRRLGTTAPIEVVPWARGYRQVTTLPNVGLFATTRTVEREKLFHWVGPISATTAHFYMRRSGPRFDDMEQARNAESIVIPRAWYLEQMLRGIGFRNISAVNTPTQAVRMLAAGRAPLMALDDVTLADTMVAAGVDAKDIEPGFVITQAVQYVAFSRETPNDVVASWQKTLDEMKADGSFERIYAKWLPGVRPPGLR